MRRFEIAGTVGLLLYVPHLSRLSVGHEAIFGFLLSLAVLLIACHVRLEGYRWQMVPAYFLACSLVFYECVHWLWGFQTTDLAAVLALLFGGGRGRLLVFLFAFKAHCPPGPPTLGQHRPHLL